MRHHKRTLATRRTWLGHDDAGFTLIEATMAIFLVVILISGLTQALVAALASQAETRRQEQATVLAIEGIEYARSVPWTELGLDPAADSTDPLVITIGSDHLLDGSYVNLPSDELIVEFAGGLVPSSQVETLDERDYLVKSYVTEVEPELRRVTVVVEWVTNSATRRHHSSTLISEVTAP